MQKRGARAHWIREDLGGSATSIWADGFVGVGEDRSTKLGLRRMTSEMGRDRRRRRIGNILSAMAIGEWRRGQIAVVRSKVRTRVSGQRAVCWQNGHGFDLGSNGVEDGSTKNGRAGN